MRKHQIISASEPNMYICVYTYYSCNTTFVFPPRDLSVYSDFEFDS